MSCKCVVGGDVHATSVSIFNLLANYSWDAKAVLALAAFAINYGEFWLVAQLYPSNSLARDVALLKQLPQMLERADILRSKFDAVIGLINAMMDLTKCVIEFKELSPQYLSRDAPELLTATPHIPMAAYWIVRSIIACTAQTTSLIGRGHEYVKLTIAILRFTEMNLRLNLDSRNQMLIQANSIRGRCMGVVELGAQNQQHPQPSGEATHYMLPANE